MAIANGSLRGLSALVSAGAVVARQPLLNAAIAHPIEAVRAQGIFEITQLNDPALRANLESAMRPGDRKFLALRPATRADIDAAKRQVPGLSTQPEPDPRSPGSGSGGSGGGGTPGPGGASGGTAGSKSGGSCTEGTAIDLGRDGHNVTVWNNGCVRVRDNYPTWWSTLTMRLENTNRGTYPVPFTWSNACTGSSGSAVFTRDWQAFMLSTTSRNCATVIDLKGSGSGTVTLRYWGP